MAVKGFWLRISSKLFLVLALAALAALSFGVSKSAIRRLEIQREIEALQAEIQAYKQQSEELTNLIDYLGTEEWRERQARLQLGLQKTGENVVVIPGLPEATVSNQAELVPGKLESNWLKWFNYFFSSP